MGGAGGGGREVGSGKYEAVGGVGAIAPIMLPSSKCPNKKKVSNYRETWFGESPSSRAQMLIKPKIGYYLSPLD